ncbi:DUF523 domain-containing protein [Vibrio sp. WJH972]
MEKVLVSSCLVGNNVRYNGSCLNISELDLNWLRTHVDMVVFCPEVSSGLPIPRPPAEIIDGQGGDVIFGAARVVANDGVDVTEPFLAGAKNALKACQNNDIKYAILAEASPSCGSSKIYDGTFGGVKIDGIGVTTALLEREGIKVFSQYTIAILRSELESDK